MRQELRMDLRRDTTCVGCGPQQLSFWQTALAVVAALTGGMVAWRPERCRECAPQAE
jgi:hypothetical protein